MSMPTSTTMGKTPQLVWLITGGSSGLGLALVHQVLARGDLVIAPVRDPSKLFSQLQLPPNAPFSENRVHAFKFDLTDSFGSMKENVDEAVKVWGRIDVLVNNAGRSTVGTLEEGGSASMLEHFNINFFGVINLTNAVLPHMRQRRSGTVAMMGSRSAFRNEFIGIGYYSAAKAAIHSYSETLSAELAPFSIRVVVVIPGSFRTPALEQNYIPVGTPILPDYAHAHVLFDDWTGSKQKTPRFACKGDPERGMEVLVDVVRGEGRINNVKRSNVEGKEVEWPLWLFIGEDGMSDVKARMDRMRGVMDKWEAVGSDVEFLT